MCLSASNGVAYITVLQHFILCIEITTDLAVVCR